MIKDRKNSERSTKKKTSRERRKRVVEEKKERVSHSSLDSSCYVCNEDRCNTSIEGNNGSSDDISSSDDNNICGGGQGGNCGSDSDTDTDKQDSIIETTLCHYPGSPLGFKVVGGSNTPLQYISIHSLVVGTPAFDCGLFCKGDQLVMVGDTCMIGLTREEATLVLKQAPPVVKVIAQRKLLPMKTSGSQECSKAEGKGKGKAGGVETTASKCLQPVENTSSQDHKTMKSTSSQGFPRGNKDGIDQATAPKHLQSVETVKQEGPKTRKEKARNTGLGAPTVVDLTPNPGEMLGISITGGISDPYLKNIHVSYLMKTIYPPIALLYGVF